MKDPERKISSCSKEEENWIDTQIEAFNRSQFAFTHEHLETPMNYVIKEGNKFIAGIKSCFYLGEVLSIGVLFVDEDYRQQGLGKRLLEKAEKDARALGAKLAHLYAFDQTKDYYLKHGYEVYGVLENCPKEGHKCYYLKKNIITYTSKLKTNHKSDLIDV
jgi:N-acetylglutamate synthase-like GNAT family acetyltransferase